MERAIKILDLLHIGVIFLILLSVTFVIGLADAPTGQRLIVEIFAMFVVWTWLFYIAVAISNNQKVQKIISAVLFGVGVLLFFSFIDLSGDTVRPAIEVIDSFLLRAWLAIAAAVAFAFSHFAHDVWLRFQRNIAAVCFSAALFVFVGILAYNSIVNPLVVDGVTQGLEASQAIILLVGAFVSVYTFYRAIFVKD